MTAQVHEVLFLDGEELSMDCCPDLPEDHPSIISSDVQEIDKPCPNCGKPLVIKTGRFGTFIGCTACPNDKFAVRLRDYEDGLIHSTACWRGYVGTWEIKDEKFYLKSIIGKYVLLSACPIMATWFSGIISVPLGEIVEYVHAGFSSLYEKEMYIQIEKGHVIAKKTFDNGPESSDQAFKLMTSAFQLANEDKGKAIGLFKDSESHASSFWDLVLLAYYIYKSLHDHDWARSVYRRALQKSREPYELLELEFFIRYHLEDIAWANEILIESIDSINPENHLEQISALARRIENITKDDDIQKITESLIPKTKDPSFLTFFGADIFLALINTAINQNSKHALSIFSEIKNTSRSASILIPSAKEVSQLLNDKELTTSLFKKSEKYTDNFSESMALAEAIIKTLGDKSWARRIYAKADKLIDNYASDKMELASSVIVHLGDREWGANIYHEIHESDAYVSQWDLAKAISSNLGDKKWARELFQAAVNEYKAKWPDDLYKHGIDIAIDLGDKKWAKEIYQYSEEILFRFQKDDSCSVGDPDLIKMSRDIIKALGDAAWAKRLYNKTDKKKIHADDLYQLAETISSCTNDLEWATDVTNQAKKMQRETNAKNEAARLKREERRNRRKGVTSLPVNLQDPDKMIRYYKAKEINARNAFDLIELGEQLMRANDTSWAVSVFRKAAALASSSNELSALYSNLCQNVNLAKHRDESWVHVLTVKYMRLVYRRHPDINKWIQEHQAQSI